MKTKTKMITEGAMISALYILLTMLARIFGLDSGAIQLRISEALCVLPCFTPSAIGGLFVGCFLSNILAGAVIWDVIFGSLATLIGAVFTYKLRGNPVIATIPPILSNTLIISLVLSYAYHLDGALWYFMLTVGIGEILSCGVLGIFLYTILNRYKKYLFK